MSTARDRAEAIRVAEAYLISLKRGGRSSRAQLTVDAARAVSMEIWWHDWIELYEIPLKDATGAASGYVLAALDSRLPPVLEHCETGPTFSDCIAPSLSGQGFPALSKEPRRQRLVFINSTLFYLDVLLTDGARGLLDPIRQTLESAYRVPMARTNPTTVFDQSLVQQQWADLVRQAAPGAKEYVIPGVAPTPYNQDCEDERAFCPMVLNGSTTRCNPVAISGCVPVAWALLACAYKKLGLSDSHKIWNGDPTWDVPWPSTEQSSRSAAVRKSIWYAHQQMQTDINGGTYPNTFIHGREIFRQMGIGWEFSVERYRWWDFHDSCRRDRPSIWTSVGPWRGEVGHAVLVYGFSEPKNEFKVALGWGSGRADRWINIGQYYDFHGVMAQF